MKENKNPILKLLLIYLVVSNSAKAEGIPVPPGFEDLVRGDDQILDVLLYGKDLGFFKAHVDLEKVKFHEPDKVAQAVKNSFNHDEKLKNIIMKELALPLDKNSNLACSAIDKPGCDYIATAGDKVKIIYDENNTQILLFLPPEYSRETKDENRYFSATEDTHNAVIHQQSVNYSVAKESQSLSLQGNTAIGMNHSGYVDVDWNWNLQKFQSAYSSHATHNGYMNNVFFRQDFLKKYYLQVGVMDTRDIYSNAGGALEFNQLPIDKIEGVRIGSTLAWQNLDLHKSATPVSIMLSRDARVDIYRGNQLLNSQYMKAGSQLVNTDSLPPGSYVLTLKIYEDNKLVRTEERPYTQINNSADNSYQWFLQSGKLSSQGVSSQDQRHSVTGGFRIPFTRSVSLTTGGTLRNNKVYNESALNWVHGFNSGALDGVMNVTASYFTSNNKVHGTTQKIYYNDGFSFSFFRSSYYQCSRNDHSYVGDYQAYSYTSMTTMITLPVMNWSASLSYFVSNTTSTYPRRRYIKYNQDNDLNNEYYVSSMEQTVSNSKKWQLSLSHTFMFNQFSLFTSISAYTNQDNRYRGRETGGYINMSISLTGRSSLPDMNFGTKYSTSNRGNDEVNYSADLVSYRGNNANTANGLTLSVDQQKAGGNDGYLSVYHNYSNSVSSGSLYVSDSYHSFDNSHTLNSTGSLNFSVAADRQGIYPGQWNSGDASSAVLIDTYGSPDDAIISANTSSTSSVNIKGNSRRILAINPYKQESVQINESDSITQGELTNIVKGSGARSIFMVPGQIYSQHVGMSIHYTWMGVMLADKTPLTDAKPLNVDNWTELGKGAFLLETSRQLSQLYLVKNQVFWKCEMKVKKIQDVVRLLGTTSCKNVTYAMLPPEEAKEVLLMTASQNTTPEAEKSLG